MDQDGITGKHGKAARVVVMGELYERGYAVIHYWMVGLVPDQIPNSSMFITKTVDSIVVS